LPEQIIIKNEELLELLDLKHEGFPKYASQLINLANQNAQGTRPQVVGQLSQLIQEFPGSTYEQWVEWYTGENPEAIDRAVSRIAGMIEKLKEVINVIDEPMIKRWVEDLVHCKTFVGLRFQEAVLKKISGTRGCQYRLSTSGEESRGIDGYLGDMPVSIKPLSYKSKNMLPEGIEAGIIYYEKTKAGILVEY
jgi:hypothetical protein